MRHRRLEACIIALVSLLPAGLAGTQEEPSAEGDGERVPVAVLPLGLTDAAHARYPQLAERSVGFGLHSMLVNHLYDAGRFRFVEDKPEVVEDLLERQWVAASGAVDKSSAVRHGRLLGARYVIYGEVYDFSVRRLRKKKAETRISVQVRWVDVETSEYVPASGEAVVTRTGEVFPGEVDLARSTVGIASDQALSEAVAQLLRRIDPRI